jgi:hypothetical protein
MKAVETAMKLRAYIWAAMEIIDRHKDNPDIVEEGKERMETYQAAEELVNKQIPKKPLNINIAGHHTFDCPTCSKTIIYLDDKHRHKYCLNCGQALDWEGE